MKIYTRTGDAGSTSLVGGRRTSKASPRLDAYGTVDELNSHLGLLRAVGKDALTPDDAAALLTVQNRLFNIGAYLATDTADLPDGPDTSPQGLSEADVTLLEERIDALDAILPPLRSFILPGGTVAAAQANVTRTVCRRAERNIATLQAARTPVHPLVPTFINRLSDYLFILGRALNHAAGCPDIPWSK